MADNQDPAIADAPIVDARGLACPLPVLRLRKALTGLAPGKLVRLLATDRVALRDVPAFCASAGHEVLDTADDKREVRFVVRRGRSSP